MVNLTLSPAKIALSLTIFVVLITLASWATQFAHFVLGYGELLGLRPVLDVGSDISLPTWYSSFALLFCAVLLALIAIDKKRCGGRFARHWQGLALIFLLMSIDETAGIHERAGYIASRTFETTGFLYYGWIVLGIAFVLIAGVAYLRFLAHLPKPTRHLFVLAALVFLGGALGVEAYNSRYDYLYGSANIHYATTTTLEEFLEKMGIVIFIYALLSYMTASPRHVVVRITAKPGAAMRATPRDVPLFAGLPQ